MAMCFTVVSARHHYRQYVSLLCTHVYHQFTGNNRLTVPVNKSTSLIQMFTKWQHLHLGTKPKTVVKKKH